jgi:hypothetical protein
MGEVGPGVVALFNIHDLLLFTRLLPPLLGALVMTY